MTATAIGDLNGEGENVEVFAETAGGTSLGILFDMAGCSEYSAPCTDTIQISQTRLGQFAADGLISFAFVIDSDNGAASVRYQSINLTYPLLGPGCSGLAPGQGGTVPPGQLDPPGCSGYAPGHQNGAPVSSVPLPAALPLLFSALAALYGFSRWRRALSAIW